MPVITKESVYNATLIKRIGVLVETRDHVVEKLDELKDKVDNINIEIICKYFDVQETTARWMYEHLVFESDYCTIIDFSLEASMHTLHGVPLPIPTEYGKIKEHLPHHRIQDDMGIWVTPITIRQRNTT